MGFHIYVDYDNILKKGLASLRVSGSISVIVFLFVDGLLLDYIVAASSVVNISMLGSMQISDLTELATRLYF